MSAQERRASILDAAVKLFAERGFRGTTTRDLAAAVGVSEPVLYEHFPSKRDLYLAILDAKASEGLREFRDLSADYLARNDDRGFFIATARMIMMHYLRDPDLPRLLLMSALEEPEMKQADIPIRNRFLEILESYVAKRISQGALRSTNARLVSEAFAGMFCQMGQDRILGYVPPEQEPVDIEAVVELFLDGLANQAFTASHNKEVAL